MLFANKGERVFVATLGHVDRIRVAFLVHVFYPEYWGGSEYVTKTLATIATDAGMEATVVTSGSQKFDAVYNVVKFAHPEQDAARYINKGDFDVVVIFGTHVWPARIWQSLDKRLPVVWFPCFSDVVMEHDGLYQHAAAVAVASPHGGFGSHYIPYVIDVHDMAATRRLPDGIPPDAQLVLFPGGYWPHKRIEDLEKVAAVIEAEYGIQGVHYVVTGANRDGARFRSHDNITYMDIVPRPVLNRLYQQATVVGSLSNNECYGLTFLEAGYFWKPVVARHVGVADMLPHVVTTCDGYTEWARELAVLLTNHHLRDRLGRLGHEIVVNHYTVPDMAPALVDLLEEVSRGNHS